MYQTELPGMVRYSWKLTPPRGVRFLPNSTELQIISTTLYARLVKAVVVSTVLL